MLHIHNTIFCYGCRILAVLLILQFTGCAQVEQMKNTVSGELAYGAGNNSLVEDNHFAAAAHYREAAESGHPRAAYILGLLSAGSGSLKNETEVLKWMRLSAENGYAPAQEHLGMWYLVGAFVPEDPAEAVRWFSKAADQGNKSAMYFLGTMNAKGQGLPIDYDRALGWFQMANTEGFPVPPEQLTMDGVVALSKADKDVQTTPAQTSAPVLKSRPATVRNVQDGLTELGYKPGPVDGMMGKKTFNAIRAFQRDVNMPQDGKVSEELMRRIETKLNQ